VGNGTQALSAMDPKLGWQPGRGSSSGKPAGDRAHHGGWRQSAVHLGACARQAGSQTAGEEAERGRAEGSHCCRAGEERGESRGAAPARHGEPRRRERSCPPGKAAARAAPSSDPRDGSSVLATAVG
jgi:hypothetical protein